MAGHQQWKCNNCNYQISTSGDHEFYRDNNGHRKWYGHPGPASKEAKEAGVKGFSVRWYCPKCRQVEDAIVREFHEARKHDFWVVPRDALVQYEPLCLKCNTELQEDLGEDTICPKCNEGKFERGAFLIS
jgi:Zn finger protein HypA/HybF involved in hydrogenase expression